MAAADCAGAIFYALMKLALETSRTSSGKLVLSAVHVPYSRDFTLISSYMLLLGNPIDLDIQYAAVYYCFTLVNW